MKLVVISPEKADAREPAVLAALFEAGLERYHVRKPGWSQPQLEAWLLSLPATWRPRLVLHQHHGLVAKLGLGGCHWRDDGSAPLVPPAGSGLTSRSCHDPASLESAIGRYDSVFYGPIFPSISKPGHGPLTPQATGSPALRSSGPLPSAVRPTAHSPPLAALRPSVLALGGITPENAGRCLELGFDGVAVLGAIWQADDPLKVFAQLVHCMAAGRPAVRPSAPRSFLQEPIMAITQDGLELDHRAQAERLCAAGARWIQLRMKRADHEAWLATARAVVSVCRTHGAICIVNDSIEVALAAGADGVHLGELDLEWREARRRLRPGMLIGGTVNNGTDATRARSAGCLDYVGVGPLRFTSTKEKLAPVLGLAGVGELIAQLGDLPAWVIGGVEPADLAGVRAAGAAGVAVSSALLRGGCVEENFQAFHDAWAPTTDTVSAS